MYRTYLRVASLLVLVIRAEVAKTDTSFLRCPGLFEVQNNSLQNVPSYYSCNKWPYLRSFNLCHCMLCQEY